MLENHIADKSKQKEEANGEPATRKKLKRYPDEEERDRNKDKEIDSGILNNEKRDDKSDV